MLHRTYEGQDCSIARTLEIAGERWTFLILRDACVRGVRRYADFQRGLGIARNVLATRLDTLCEHGLLERVRYRSDPDAYEYVPTQMGRDLFPALLAMMRWGDRYLANGDPPIVLEHEGCGGDLVQSLTCADCGAELTVADVGVRQPA
jgi:DNA-binding HxlR family transcriptional regulator